MKDKLRNGFLIVVAVILIGYLLVAGTLELTSKDHLVTLQPKMGVPAMTVEHSAMGIIPIGQEHYFLVGENANDVQNIYIVRAGKNWATECFDANALAKDKNFTVTALKKRLDYDVEQEFAAELTEEEGIQYPLGAAYYLDVNYQFAAIMKIVAGGLFLVTAVAVIVRKFAGSEGKAVSAISAVTFVAGLLVAVFGLW